jgi:sialate O-acetylesterase
MKYILIIIVFIASCLTVSATISLPRLISNGIVLQRETAIPVWGFGASGENVAVTFNSNTYNAVTGADGKWQVSIPSMNAGGPYTMTVAGTNTITVSDILIGDVFFCSGQSNMAHVVNTSASIYASEIASSANNNIRHFKVTRSYNSAPQDDVASVNGWQSANPINVLNFSAVAYFFARDLYVKTGVAIGLINSSYEGTPAQAWMSQDGLVDYPNYTSFTPNTTNPEYDPSVLYNAMVYPFLKLPFKSVLWYQGESNRLKSYEYRKLFPALITNWRSKFNMGGNFPFLFVQLHNYLTVVSTPQESNVAECREAQAYALSMPNTAMAVIHETNTDTVTHPLQKKPVGERLSLAAQNLLFGNAAIVYKSPSYNSMIITGNKMVVSFNDIGGGLVAQGGALQRFSVAGTDREFYNATAVLVGNTVEVSSPMVAKPVAVRYAWFDNPNNANLYNTNGLPVRSFRTDDWSGLTYLLKDVPTTLSTAFTAGNLIVYKYSTGDATKTLSGSLVPVYLDEYSTSANASPTKRLAIPTTTVGTNFRLTGLPKTGSPLAYAPEGLPTLSQNGQYLTLFGYDQAIAATTTSTVNRVIARIDNAGNINSSTTILPALGQPRSVIADGNSFWIAGNTGGVQLATLGSIGTSTVVAASPGASRGLSIFNSKLYCFIGDTKVYNFNNLPTSTATAISTAALTGAAGNNQTVLFDANNDGTPDLMYMADDGLIASPQNAALRKYQLVSGSWVAKGAITVADTALIHGVKSITGTVVGNSVYLYAVTWGNQTSFSPSKLLKFVDNNASSSTITLANSNVELLAIADTNTMFRGVTFTPGTVVNSALPVRLVSFTGKKVNEQVSLSWSTAFEQNASHFNIERSSNGVEFDKMGTLTSSNNTNGNTYSFNDNKPLKGVNYYRLQQVDKDGSSSFSNIVRINFDGNGMKVFKSNNGELTVQIDAAVAGQFSISIVDVQGRKLVQQASNLAQGTNAIKLNTQLLSAGTYVVLVVLPNETITQQFVQ